MESRFWEAARRGKVDAVKMILRDNPTLDVNWRNPEENQSTALRQACADGQDPIAAILLAHPDIDVNLKNRDGYTPLYSATYCGRTACVRLLLKDPRVMPNEPNALGFLPVHRAVFYRHDDIIKWWIASGREMDLGKPGDDRLDAIGEAKKIRSADVAELLERFKENPLETRHAVRLELGLVAELAAELFALVVFVSDGLLQVKDTAAPAARFFKIAQRFPLELQMVLCCRVMRSAKELIPSEDSEVAFKHLAKVI